MAPSNFSDFPSACSQAGLKARLETELAAAADDEALEKLRVKFSEDERHLEHAIDHTPHTFSATIDIDYNVCLPRALSLCPRAHASVLPCAVPLQVDGSRVR